MIESGIIIFAGMLLLFLKLPRRAALKLLGYALALDLTVSIFVLIVHWGTFSGVMAAAVAGLMTSGFSAAGRWLIGYIDRRGLYHRGVMAVPLR